MLELAELRALPDGEQRLDLAIANIGSAIEGPTLGQWLGILLKLNDQVHQTDPMVLLDLPQLVMALAGLSPEKSDSGQPLSFDNSLVVLRNTIAHGGSITTLLAGQLLDGVDAKYGWDARVRDALGTLACFSGSRLIWFDEGVAWSIASDGNLADQRHSRPTCRLRCSPPHSTVECCW